MLSSIRKFSKSFLAKVFVAIIALPFVLWGMGDIFSSGKQNVIVEINKDKISSKEFITYVESVKLNSDEINKIGKSNILDSIYHLAYGKSFFNPLSFQNINFESDLIILDNSSDTFSGY